MPTAPESFHVRARQQTLARSSARWAAGDRVAEAEATGEHCLEFFKIMEPPYPSMPNMGVLSFEQVKTYE